MRERRKETKETLAGSLLLAHPVMRDPNFRHSVVLMSVHNAEGAMGVVLNRPMNQRLGELNGEFALGPLAGVPLFKGGPVHPEQLIIAAWQARPDGFRTQFPAKADRETRTGHPDHHSDYPPISGRLLRFASPSPRRNAQ